ncbi:MAG: hypothetical protein H7268_04285 [Sandarakinorhabdus sp.]|nr:hypothetical protein [Sandarakinorhabdus sp.]
MRKIRQFHFYTGVFFAPLIILFALSGALQTFRLQEEKGWGGQPPAWIETMASIHKDSKLPRAKAPEAEHDQAAPAVAAGPDAAKPVKPRPPGVNKLPMQIFLTAMSIGLMLSAFLGIAIAINNKTTRRLSIIMLAAGTILPIILLMAA